MERPHARERRGDRVQAPVALAAGGIARGPSGTNRGDEPRYAAGVGRARWLVRDIAARRSSRAARPGASVVIRRSLRAADMARTAASIPAATAGSGSGAERRRSLRETRSHDRGNARSTPFPRVATLRHGHRDRRRGSGGPRGPLGPPRHGAQPHAPHPHRARPRLLVPAARGRGAVRPGPRAPRPARALHGGRRAPSWSWTPWWGSTTRRARCTCATADRCRSRR